MEWRTQTEVSTFVDAAQAFCHLVAQPTAHPSWLCALLSKTLALYAAGLALPDVTVANFAEDVEAVFSVSHEEWHNVWQQVGDALAADRWYRPMVPRIDPMGEQQEACVSDLADDLADIYRDITPGLRYWQTGTDMGRASVIWQWRMDFARHWGNHAVAALGILHHLINTA